MHPEYLFEREPIVSNLKLVAGTVKRRGIAIAAAVAVAGGSLATANYAMAVEVNEPTWEQLHAEFSGTEAAEVAVETAKEAAAALKGGASETDVQQILKTGLKNAAGKGGADFTQQELQNFEESQLNGELQGVVDSAKQTLAKKKLQQPNLELNEARAEALVKLEQLTKLNPLQRSIFKKQIEDATSEKDVKIIFGAAEAEDKNPVAPFAPVPGEKAPAETPDTDVEKALDYTKAEALEKLRSLSHLTEQQKAFYEEMVNAATQVFEVEDAYEAGVAKNQVNEEAKKASGFLAKAIARTKHLALQQLEGFTKLTHEQKKEARNKILAAKQVFEVEAAFHGAEKLNKAAK